jgi:hypothetical protein
MVMRNEGEGHELLRNIWRVPALDRAAFNNYLSIEELVVYGTTLSQYQFLDSSSFKAINKIFE